MTKTLIGLSGGLDSTYSLYKLLKDTSDEVTAVIITFSQLPSVKNIQMDIESVTQSENKIQNIRNLATWLKSKVRDFTLIEHEYDANIVADTPYKNAAVYITKYALSKINNNEIDNLVMSHEKENDGFNNSSFGYYQGYRRALDIFKENATRGTISFPLIESNYHQAYALTTLPAELLLLTRSCNDSNFDADPCGLCFKCSKRIFFQKMIDKGLRMGDIYDYIMEKSTLPNGKWRSMKSWLGEEIPTHTRFNKKHDNPIGYFEVDMPQYPESYTVP